jgi:hypothetical protein
MSNAAKDAGILRQALYEKFHKCNLIYSKI